MLQYKYLSITSITYNGFFFNNTTAECLRTVQALARKSTKDKDVLGSITVVDQNLIKFQHYMLMPRFLTVSLS